MFSDLDIEPFEDQSNEQNRSESELSTYLSSLYNYTRKKRYALPRHRNKDQPLYKSLYNYDKTKSTDIDTRPSYYKFMENMEKQNPELFNELNESIPTEELIDMSYLQLHENKSVPSILTDDEYPDWV